MACIPHWNSNACIGCVACIPYLTVNPWIGCVACILWGSVSVELKMNNFRGEERDISDQRTSLIHCCSRLAGGHRYDRRGIAAIQGFRDESEHVQPESSASSCESADNTRHRCGTGGCFVGRSSYQRARGVQGRRTFQSDRHMAQHRHTT